MKKLYPLDKWLYPLIIFMGVYFLIRIIDQSKMLYLFPVVNNDLGSYVAQLHLLKVCGFHNFCPYWYNGFINFLISSPGWEFFTYPLYILFNNILLSTYISSISMYIIGFIFIYYLGKSQNFSLTKIVAFFILIFANSINIGNFILMGRMPSLNATIFFLGLAMVIYSYKDRKLDKKFVFVFVLLNVLVILSHYQEAILSQFLILSLFLTKKGYEKIIILLSFVLSLILSAFWWTPFLLSSLNLEQSSITTREQGKWLLQILPEIEFTTQFFTSVLIIIIPVVLFIVFYFYWTYRKKSSKEILFFSPILILGLLFWLKLTAYTPLLKHISPDPFLNLFLFFILILFFKTDFNFYPKILRFVIIIFLIILPIMNTIVSHTKTPYWDVFEYGDVEKETLSLFKFIDQNEKFVFASWPPSTYAASHPAYYYAYATVYNNLSTPEGYYRHIAPQNYLEGIGKIIKEKDCKNLKNIMLDYNTTYTISYDEKCEIFRNCGWIEIEKKSHACLYRL